MNALGFYDAISSSRARMRASTRAGIRVGLRTGAFSTALATLGLCFVVVAGWAAPVWAGPDVPAADSEAAPIVLAQDGGTEPRELEPRYQAPPPGTPGPYNDQEHDIYTTDYLFAMTRGVAGSTMVPALKVPLFLFTVPLDLVFLPFEAIGGFF